MRRLIHHLLADVGAAHPQALVYPLTVATKSPSAVRMQVAMGIMDTIREVTGIEFEPVIKPRRAGDPARIVATGELARRDLEWEMRHDLRSMVATAWEARQAAGADYPS